jgi:hypothetical protein
MSKLTRATDQKTTILPDGYIAVFSTTSNHAFTLPPMAALAWEFMDGEHSEEEIVQSVSQVLGSEVSLSELREQISQLVKELAEANFLVDDQSPPPG